MIHRHRRTSNLFILAAGLGLLLLAPAVQAVTFTDGEFVPSQWQSHTFLTQTSTANSSTLPGSGNPGAHRSIVLYASTGFLQPQGRSLMVELKTSAVVHPTAVGGITQIDYSEDHYCECFGGGVLWGPAIEQGGKFYIVPGNAIPNGIVIQWVNVSLSGLTAADFAEVDVNSATWTNPASQPDFSASGAPVTFGFVRAKAFVAHTESVLDNWSIGVNENVVANEQRSWGALKAQYR